MSMHESIPLTTQMYALPGPHDEDEESDAVQWKASQTTNRALDSLMLEAQEAQSLWPAKRTRELSWGSPLPPTSTAMSRSTSDTTLFVPPPSTATSRVAKPPRRRTRASQSFDAGLGSANASESASTSLVTDPAMFLKVMLSVSRQADENAGIRPSGSSSSCSSTGRRGVKERTMNVKRELGHGYSGIGSAKGKGKGKGKERDSQSTTRPLTRSGSIASVSTASFSPSSVSSPASNSSYSLASGGEADASMTSPEKELMPPPPIPPNRLPPVVNRLPALDVCAPRPSAQAQSRAYPADQPVPNPNPPPARSGQQLHQPPRQQQQQAAPAQRASGSSSSSRPPSMSEAPVQMHPLLQQKAPPSAHAIPTPNPIAKTDRLPAPPTHSRSQSQPPSQTHAPQLQPQAQQQPQQRRGGGGTGGGPPALGMRRVNTAPLGPVSASGSVSALPVSGSQSHKFRPPLLNPNPNLPPNMANAGAGAVAAAGPVRVKSEPVLKAPPPLPVPIPARAPDSSPSDPDADVSFEDQSSFDMDELERVMQTYD
ncbi:hypothetical protein B0H11DRAFT_2237491 [Mycena galericulata]|nr:hypothetical protein B0H11DRAFT_2237491 [Mycena galericulata]